MQKAMNRREMIKKSALAAGMATAGITGFAPVSLAKSGAPSSSEPLKGNIRHSVCRWTMGFLSLPEICQTVKSIGFSAIDLVGPSDWNILKSHGIDSSMCNGAEISLTEGWNDPQYHAELTRRYTEHINLVADAGYTNLICFSGNRRGMDDESGLDNSVNGLKSVLSLAEKRGVVLQMELFNSKVDHPDYMCDNSVWGIELCKRIESPNFKLLYDIYHMQINEGDIIRTIQDNHIWFGHFHTAGVPGRNEIEENQELNYPAIMRAIHETGFGGYVAQEFMSKAPDSEGKIAALSRAISICDV